MVGASMPTLPIARPPTEIVAARPRTRYGGTDAPSKVTSTCSAPAMASTIPFASKKSTGRCPALQCAVTPLPVSAAATRRDSPARVIVAPELEEPHIGALAVAIVRDRREQTGQQRRSKHRKLRRERIADWHDRPRVGKLARLLPHR